MTGSEHPSTSCTNSKPATLGKETKLGENCEQINEASSSSASSCSPIEGDKSLGSSNNSSNVISQSLPSTQKSYSDFTANYTKESMAGKEPSLCRTAGTNRSSMSHPKMKRTISNSTVRSHNASTLCSQGSSYVYHYPSNVARKNHHHQQQQQHRSIQPSPTPSSLMVTSITTNFYLPLCEDTASDETQSMVELSEQPSRMLAQHRASVRREKEASENNHTSKWTTHRGAGQPQAAVRDHLQHSNQKHEKLPISKRQLDCTRPKASSHIDLERTCGNLAVYGEQKQLFHNNHHHQQPHHHTLHRLTNHHQMMRSHVDLSQGWSCSSKSHTWQTHNSSSNICRMNGGIAQASTGQVSRPHTLRSMSVSSTSDKRITLHIPSGRKHESLI